MNTPMLPVMVRSQERPKRLSDWRSRQKTALTTIQSSAATARSNAPDGSRRRVKPRTGRSQVIGARFRPTIPAARLGIGASHCRASTCRRHRLTKQAQRIANGAARLATSRAQEKLVMAAQPPSDGRFQGSRRKAVARSRAQARSLSRQGRSPPGCASAAIPV